MRKLWTIRVVSLLLFLAICILLIYRISIWYNQYKVRFTSSNLDPTNESTSAAWSSSQVPITLCNLNPVRGYEIFHRTNGSRLYDEVVDKWKRGSITYRDDSLTFLPRSLIQNASHRLNDMLRWCFLSTTHCYDTNFHPVWFHNRFCHQIILEKKDTTLTLALDPEERHYLIPGYGFIGFKLCIENIIHKNLKHPTIECFYLSNKLHTIIGVTRSVAGEDPQCALALFEECKSKCIDYPASNCSCVKYLQYCHFSYHISSNLQAAPSPFFNHLFKMESYKKIHNLCDHLIPILIQWRAVLRFMKPLLFLKMIKLSNLLFRIQSKQLHMISLITNLQKHISSDLERLKHIKDDSKLCDLPRALDRLNLTCNLFHHKNVENNNSLALCQKHLQNSGFFELSMIEILFSQKEIIFTDPSFRQKLNQLSMLNMEFRTRSLTLSCINTIIQKMGEYYSQQITNSISLLVDYSLNCDRFQSGVLSLKNASTGIITFILQKQQTTQDSRNLVTVTIDISTNPYLITAKPVFYKQNVLPVTIISELIDIVCSSTALAALFILIIKCLRSRLKASETQNKRTNINLRQRASGTTQTEMLEEDDMIITPVTFTL